MARQLFTARSGGSSTGNYHSLNVADHVGDVADFVDVNRETLKRLISVDGLAFMNQVHGNQVEVISKSRAKSPTADALVTNIKGIGLAVMVADCLPILIDGVSVVAAVHVGRKGMVNGIIKRTVAKVRELGGVNLTATIGPGICAKCYEVDEEMYQEIVREFPKSDAGFRKIDIRGEATNQLEGLGVVVNQIDICTLENNRYFSYRRSHETGRQCGVIAL
jgi:YfiH family protein